MVLRVLTYNIHRAIGVDRKFRPERIIEILEFHDADIVMLQEVDRYAARSGHLDLASYLARHLRYDYRAIGMNVHMRSGKYGNATLSRFPIGKQRNIDLTIAWRKRRGAQHTRIRVSKGSESAVIDVFNVHLGLSAMERNHQVNTLLSCPDVTELSETAPCIIGGDMNDWRGLLKRPRFGSCGFQCATSSRPGTRFALRTFPSYAPTGALDKLFYRGPLKLVSIGASRLKVARIASDHLPVIADFELTPSANPECDAAANDLRTDAV